MTAPLIRYYVAASLDGYIASADGGVAWLEPFQGDYGYEAFFDSIASLVMGRTTYDQILSFGDWPYEVKPCHVLTARALEPPTGQIMATEQPADILAARLREESTGDIWLVGGGRAAAAFLAARALDWLELFVMPLLLGGGIPLFGPVAGPTPARLLDQETFPDGVSKLVYDFDL